MPDGNWELAGFSKSTLDEASKFTKARLEIEASKLKKEDEEAIRRKTADELIKKERTKVATQSIEKAKSRIGENRSKLEKLKEELKELNANLEKEEDSFFGTYGLNYNDLTRTSVSVEIAKNKRDNFQFTEDL